MEPLGIRVDKAIDDIGREDMARVRIGIAKEVGESYRREGVVVREDTFEKLHGHR